MTGTELLDPRRDTRWARFVDEASEASVFHHPEWLALLHRTYGYPLAACCVVRAGRVEAGLPVARVVSRLTGRRLVALPFSDLCGPVVPAAAEGRRGELLEGLVALSWREALDLEIRATVDDLPGGHPTDEFLHHRLRLGKGSVVADRRPVSSSARRGARKARHAGLVAERHTGDWGLAEFYRLHLRTRRRQGVPIQPKRFIMGLERLFARGLGFTMLVRDGNEVIAAAVFLTCNGVLTYKYGASDERRLNARPNNLLFTEAIDWGAGNGCHTLDFGRTSPENTGLAAFKRGWGAEERTVGYTSTAADADLHLVEDGRAARTLKVLIQRGPPGLSRLTGELLYKHVG